MTSVECIFRQLILVLVISQVALFFDANPFETKTMNGEKKLNNKKTSL
tara:strand:- start:324 stop:467 length:144 start_codon:yes stop_codon:yes gene_type:complete